MKVTARNYSAKAERSMRELKPKMAKANMYRDAAGLGHVADQLRDSVKFCLPDGGKVFNDGYKGIINSELRLPYRSIAVEYYSPVEAGDIGEGQVAAPKRIVLAEELKLEDVRKYDPETASNLEALVKADYYISFAMVSDLEFAWIPYPIAILIPNTGWTDKNFIGKDRLGINVVGTSAICPDSYDESLKRGLTSETMQMEMVSEVYPVLEMLEALSCSNVTHEPIVKVDARKNAKRVKAGKLPFYETHCLVIKQNGADQQGRAAAGKGDRSGPRQHLRRGHIRRLADRNIWVNSCVVGNALKGVVWKDYEIGG